MKLVDINDVFINKYHVTAVEVVHDKKEGVDIRLSNGDTLFFDIKNYDWLYKEGDVFEMRNEIVDILQEKEDVIHYHVCSGFDHELENEVEKMFDRGFRLYGSPYCKPPDGMHFQAMVRYL